MYILWRKPSNIARCKLEGYYGNPYLYNGLDRIDSSCKHTLNNVVPCCIICNRMKNDRSLHDFNNWIIAVYNRISIIKSKLYDIIK